MSTVLVTGANGFIGSHLIEHLQARGDSTLAMVRQSSDLSNLADARPDYRYADVNDLDAMAEAFSGVDIVYHVAGITAAFTQERLNAVNGQGPRNVFAAAAKAKNGPRRVVLVSSLEAAGPSIEGVPRREAHKPTPYTWYGASKALGEQAAWEAAQADHGYDVVIVRPPLVYGPRDQDVLQMIQSANKRVIANPGFVEYAMSAVHAHDLCRGIALAAERGKALPRGGSDHALVGGGYGDAHVGDPTDPAGAGIYYFTDGGKHSVIRFGHEAARACGKRAFVLKIPRPIAVLAALATELVGRLQGKAPAYNRDKVRASFSTGWWADHSRATAELGYEPEITLEEGLAQTVRWLRDRKIL